MFLDSAAAQQSGGGMTPIVLTIIGWVVTIFAAVIPNIINFRMNRSLRKDFSDLQMAKAIGIDHTQYIEKRKSLIKDLERAKKALSIGVNGKATLQELACTLTKIQSFSERLNFTAEDKKIINDLHLLASESSNCVTTDRVQAIIEILNKGVYMV